MDLRQLAPLGFQAHSVRVALARDLRGTLRTLRAMGYESIELAYFPGFAGDYRGDFGPLTDMDPIVVRREVRAAGLTCSSCHVPAQHLAPQRLEAAARWVMATGATHLVCAGLDVPERATRSQLMAALDGLNAVAPRVHALGLKFGLHTPHAMWRTIEGLAADDSLRRIDPNLVQLQLDLGMAVQAGLDGAELLSRHPDRFFSVHLRDARPVTDPWAYLPAAPLGTGVVAWAPVLRAAWRAGIRHYVVEMTRAPGGVLDAMKESHDFLRALHL